MSQIVAPGEQLDNNPMSHSLGEFYSLNILYYGVINDDCGPLVIYCLRRDVSRITG